MRHTLTVLISTHNRAELLGRTLHYLNRARVPSDWNVDILVIANACTDGTHALLQRYVATTRGPGDGDSRLPLRWQAEPTPGKSHAQNRALPLLRAERTAFVDDDHRVDAGYLESVCRAASSHPDVEILCGRILPDWDGSEPAWVHDQGPYRIYPLPVPRYDLGDAPVESPQEIATPGGGNWIVRTDLLARVGPFATTIGPVGRGLGGSEDKEWYWRAIKRGARALYLPEIVQYHFVDPTRLTLGYAMRKAFERTAGAVRVGGETLGAARLPAYMVRKVAQNAVALITSGSAAKRRFHCVRLAGALGEIKGHWQARRERASGTGPVCE